MADMMMIHDLGTRTLDLLDRLAAITDEPGRITRLYLSPAHRRAADQVSDWMRDRGLDVTEDAIGTVRGFLAPAAPGPQANRRLLIGSHIDTVIDAGKYDGNLGVVAGLMVVEELRARGIALPFGLEVLAFGDEEGVRFPSSLSSSAAVSGTYRGEWLDTADRNGVKLRDALRAHGGDPARIREAVIPPGSVIGYVELHIEQGPVLEHQGEPLGVVTSIAGQSRFRILITGEAGHAGTVPMGLRRDAFAALAELATFIERATREGTANLVATIGRVDVKPGATNVIPSEVEATLDIRASADAPRLAAIERIRYEADQIAQRRGVKIRFERFADVPTCPMNEDLQTGLAAAVASLGESTRRLPSGAGHDAMAMARAFPSAMLFVRSRGGISHNPAEFTSVTDLGLAVEAMIRFVAGMAARHAA
ncbi:allantoate amidohydrolase [Prosthecomicrobium hirschii]|uniref:allantoate amidohydrolase n=1 Tax=Prosthecodimorpha hirschii TaxID=665126 RepID=UPI00112BB46A|nr:allantoate amidohydrolase [Prosthecomicrobium hirschii]TPQ51914.1 allantoate amidohydrolase [Prosthecomicrobium hirschii]